MKNSTYHFFFGSLSNSFRVSILLVLKDGEKSVKELSKELKTEQSKVSHALAVLKKCNLVKSRRKGKNVLYSLNKKTVIPLLNLIDKHAKLFCKGCCAFCGRCA